MPMPSFDVLEPTFPFHDGITVIHVGEGHRYTFPITVLRRRRVLADRATCQLGAAAKHSVFYCNEDARRFAETEARKRGLID
jgi:hypothetical protein